MSGGSSSSKPQASPEKVMALYKQNLPDTLGLTMAQATPTATSLAGAAAAANPIYTQSRLSQLGDYAPGYQQAGAGLAQMQAGSTADLLGGEGGRAAISGDALSRTLNPEYFNTRSATGQATTDLLRSYGTGRLSGGEMAAAERAINQGNVGTGNLGNVNTMNTVANALNFGEYARQKQRDMSNAIGQANSVVGNLQQTAYNPIANAMNAANTNSNFGLQQFNPAQGTQDAQGSMAFGSDLLSALAGVGSANRSSSWKAGLGGDCCFIFLEAQNGMMPWFVRECRDFFYEQDERLGKGYRKMAQWLVPLMARFAVIKWLVNQCMVLPITRYGGWLCNVKGYENARKYKFVRNFWFNVWSKLGK